MGAQQAGRHRPHHRPRGCLTGCRRSARESESAIRRHRRSDEPRIRAAVTSGSGDVGIKGGDTMTARSERLLSALEVEITNVSKLEHVLARTRVVLREHATRLRLGEDAEIVMTGLRFNVPAETGLALLERVDPVLSPGFVDGADDDN